MGTRSRHHGTWEAHAALGLRRGRSCTASLWQLHPPWPMNTPVGCQQSWLLAAASLPGAPPDWHRQHQDLAEGYYGRCPNPMCQQ